MKKINISSLRPLEPNKNASLDENIRKYLPHLLRLLEEAGNRKSDIVCIPEDYFYCKSNAIDISSKPVKTVADIARKFGMYVILPIMEARAGKKYNTCLLLDRDGKIIGRYDKTHITPGERDNFLITAGSEIPVFELDFGKIGIMTCFDLYYQEVARILALRGSQIIFFPHQQAEPEEHFWETLVKARAADNCVYVVASSFGVPKGMAWHPGRNDGHYPHDGYFKNIIVGMDGAIVADGGYEEGMTFATIDLDRKRIVYNIAEFGCSNLKEHIFNLRRPELYSLICERRNA